MMVRHITNSIDELNYWLTEIAIVVITLSLFFQGE
jgi:hypothetical protein